jgi:hypothetical protein
MLDRIWSLNPRAYSQLAPLGVKAGILMLAVAGALSVAGIGWFYRRRWAWSLSVALIATQIAGAVVNIYLGRVIEGAIGVAVAGAVLFCLLRPRIRDAFRR